MSTPKEIFLELLKPDGQPERQLPYRPVQHLPARQPQARYNEQGPLGYDDPVSRGRARPDAGHARGSRRLPGHHALA